MATGRIATFSIGITTTTSSSRACSSQPSLPTLAALGSFAYKSPHLSLQTSKSTITHHETLLKPLAIPKVPTLHHCQADNCTKSMEQLQTSIRKEFKKSSDPRAIMMVIDSIQRLGIAHHFEEEIYSQLGSLLDWDVGDDNLFDTALRFRLLRHNCFAASADVFKKFMDKNGDFKESLIRDTWGMLSLALKLPRHLRMARLEARNYIDEYAQERNHNPALLELAKMDFDMVQLLHQRELAEIVRWWNDLGLVEKLGFGRDRPTECFLWTVGIFPEPNDLVLFTEAIQRWDLGAMEELPEYMKISYMALCNTTNEIAYRILKQHGWNCAEQLKRTWIDIFEAFLAEAKWFNSGYIPNLKEYLSNGVTSAGSYMALVHSFFLIGNDLTKETISMMDPYPRLFSSSGEILRLWDDLGTSTEELERGDVASCIEIYMRENNMSHEDEGRKHIRKLIGKLWIELNGHLKDSKTLPPSIIKASLNLARTAQVIYQHGDDYNLSSVSDNVQRLLFGPINF
ncbi:Sesquiterpene synthase [Quillaja saponaria]|uniref:Sesquiterpene synthase n=1 Tax=Quillaja saponaria TaxID=32244 RepID=A0AAD7KYF9_QUISA|nr:Sesquiterpene synthase [Quillaja saponaria]